MNKRHLLILIDVLTLLNEMWERKYIHTLLSTRTKYNVYEDFETIETSFVLCRRCGERRYFKYL